MTEMNTKVKIESFNGNLQVGKAYVIVGQRQNGKQKLGQSIKQLFREYAIPAGIKQSDIDFLIKETGCSNRRAIKALEDCRDTVLAVIEIYLSRELY